MHRLIDSFHRATLVLTTIACIVACGGRPATGPTMPPDVVTKAAEPCPPAPGEHVVFSITIDGKDVGREVRTEVFEEGPLGPERVVTTHSVTHMKMGHAHFETRVVQVQRTLADSGILLRGSYKSMDQITVRNVLVGYNGEGWDRLVESNSAVKETTGADMKSLELEGKEVIGLRLIDAMRAAALGESDALYTISYYEPLLDRPILLELSKPLSGSIDLDGQEISGFWVEAKRAEAGSVVVRAFFDKQGTIRVEEYPDIHQIRRRMPGPLSLSSETSELLVGLHSEAYISDPNKATRATYNISGTADRLDALGLLGIPHNQTMTRQSPTELLLEVRAGAPDADEPPSKADLADSKYIRPKAPKIVGAMRYLRSAGRKGRLSRDRRFNATPVVARASLIQKPRRFWSDADQVAGLVMHYVSALIPDKRHTFSMADAVTTLERGAGDCTEHAVLFASIMRAAKIPTRLVAGMQLTRGGMWGYHMWNSYWNGITWKSIDPSTMAYHPGALHVALGQGTAVFDDLRDHLADFMWRTFSGVAFNLVEASCEGETLFLARPRGPDNNLKETALFNAVVLSARGDHKGAMDILDENIPADIRSLSVKMMRIELLVRSGKHDEALHGIDVLREETSDAHNVRMLDKLELKSLLTIGRYKEAEEVYNRIDARLSKAGAPEISRTLFKAELLFGRKDEAAAIALLEKALKENPDDSILLTSYAGYTTMSKTSIAKISLDKALAAAQRAATLTQYSNHQALLNLSRAFIRKGRIIEAGWILDHALILAPSEQTLHDLRGEIPTRQCLVLK
ncbi:MAG: hypothetical protein GY854_31130 [Deltaproteobacteria bacterium]|nr:hypothetical protein [Deltaproteobacteria bacterium]